MSKKINLLLAAALSVSMLLTGCGDNKTSTPANTGTSTSSDTTVSSADNSSVTESDSDTSSADSGSDTDSAESGNSSDADSSAPAIAEGSFKVEGSKLLDANGNEFIMRGINHAHAWYRDQLDTALEAIAATGANCVRVVLSNGEVWEKIPQDEVEKIIKKCEELKMVAILEVHDATTGTSEEKNGETVQVTDDISWLDKAADYWIELKDLVNAHTNTVIVNIANEWHNAGWANPQEWADGYKTVIPKLREAGIKNTLMVDCDGGGQFPVSLYGEEGNDQRPVLAPEVLASDPDGNTMFSIHMYEFDAKTADNVKKNIDGTIGTGVCFVIGEFAGSRSPKEDNVDEQTIMDYCTEKGIGYIAWSWKGNTPARISSTEREPYSIMDIAVEWDGSVLNEKWGDIVINGTNGIKETSKLCSVFG